MIKEQAHLFFAHSPEDDLEELWEQRFFEQKQYFLTRPPIRKVWEGRIRRLYQQYQAYLVLTDQEYREGINTASEEKDVIFSLDFITSFHEFHALRNQHKSIVLQAHDLDGLNDAIKQWLNTEKKFSIYWSHPASIEDTIEVARSKEPDPMELLKGLKETEKTIGTSTLTALKENYNNLNESVRKEVKRLTLLSKD
ncbi:MAG TPA: hypothetical protein VKY37_13485 [Brumimicrobium sp.]|nr:hypothetical protein [Brumimicrobium sp.]